MCEAGGCLAPAERATGSSPGKFGRPLFLAKMRMVLFFIFAKMRTVLILAAPSMLARKPLAKLQVCTQMCRNPRPKHGLPYNCGSLAQNRQDGANIENADGPFFHGENADDPFFVRGYLRARAVVGGVAKRSSTARYRCGYLRHLRDWTELSALRSLSCRPTSMCPGRGQPASAMPARDAYRGPRSG